jgi:general stress protein 26
MGPVAELDARFGDEGAEPTPWPAVVRMLEEAELFWISTVRAEGRPHVTPLPAVWQDGALNFCTGAGEQKAVNLARNSWCTLTTGNNRWKTGLDVVVEGRAERVVDEAHLQRLAAAWESKYHGDWHFDGADGAFQGEGRRGAGFRGRPHQSAGVRQGQLRSDSVPILISTARAGFLVEAVQRAVRLNVTCVTPLGEEVASTW